MRSSLPCFLTFCRSGIPTSCYIFLLLYDYDPLSTEGNRSPVQLFAANVALDDVVSIMYGYDPDAPAPEEEDVPNLVVLEIQLPLSDASLLYLRSAVDPWLQVLRLV